ncbi:MAG: sulfotransferase [Rhodothermales bacterium]
MSESVAPIFLFSLPRSGSTLLQRILAKHDKIDTAAEPWLLLPMLSTLRSEGIYTNYDQNAVVDAIKDFYTSIDGGRPAFLSEIQDFTLNLYNRRAEKGAVYFLDKTPRYHLVVEEIMEVFPDAKFIFLWRNPLSIIASMLDTWHRGHWYLYFFKVDLFEGFAKLVKAYTDNKDRVLGVNYEDLLKDPETTTQKICAYLDLPFQSIMIEDFQSVDLQGDMGDPTGTKSYKSISDKPLNKWKGSLRNPIRKSWCKSYLKWIGKERLYTVGYEQKELLDDLKATPFSLKRMGGDMMRISYGFIYQIAELRLFQDKLKRLPGLKRIHPHL